MSHKEIAIIGATGNVGRKIVQLLVERKKIKPEQLRLFSSARSAGQFLDLGNQRFKVEDLATYDFKTCYLALFATDSDISKTYAPKAIQAGARVIDSSSAYRLDPNVPLIVPPVNAELITAQTTLIATSNCVACPIAVVLNPLHTYAEAKRIVISTYQSTSGAGKAAMDELYQEAKSIYSGTNFKNQHFSRPIAFNVIPQVDKFAEDGFSYEEIKITKELQKLISPQLKIAATSVRVPVMVGHSISLAIEFAKPIKLDEIKALLAVSPSVKLSEHDYSTPIEIEGKDDVYVGRIRKDPTVDHGLLLWLVSDNLRRGAALDAVEIAEKILS
jgi:aspartate-semialdehyde dehydrogenase